jgi:hypothetical protein
MTTDEWYESLDEDLRALALHDASDERADRTRGQCLAVLAARRSAAARPGGLARSVQTARLGLAEPLAAVGIGVVYLVAAVRASMVLLGR